MISLLRDRTLRRFFIAHGQSQLGTGAGYVALVLIAYHRLHSGWAVALVLLADFVPATVLGAYFGALADRHSRRRLAVLADLMRACAFVALALVGSFAATVSFALLAGVGTALFRPAVGAALPALVTPEARSRATALYGALQSLGITLGPAVCGLLALLGPITVVLIANGATFALSAVLLAGIPLGGAGARPDPAGEAGLATRPVRTRYAAREPGVRAVLMLGAGCILCAAMINVAEPILATTVLHSGGSGFSLLVTVYGLGMVAGGAYTSRVAALGRLRANLLVAVALAGAAMLGCALAGNLTVAVLPFALGGFANAVIVITETRLLQELVSKRFHGRAFGLRDAIESTCFVAAFIAAGGLLSLAGPRLVYVLAGLLLLLGALLGSLVFRLPQTGWATPAGSGSGSWFPGGRSAARP